MNCWPRGVRPTDLLANTRGVEFLYRAPDDRWFRVEASLGNDAVQVRGLPGPDQVSVRRLAHAIERRLERTGETRGWLKNVARVVARLASLSHFGGAGAGSTTHPTTNPTTGVNAALDGLLGSIEHLGEHSEVGDLDQRLACAEASALDDDVLVELGIIMLLTAGRFDSALERWHRHAAEICRRRTRGALACAALMHSYLGQIARAHACAKELARQARTANDARHAGELLAQVGCHELATRALRVAASDVVSGDASAFAVHLRLAQVAAQAHDYETLGVAAAKMTTLADHPDQQLSAARMLRDAGAFADAESTLHKLLRVEPRHRLAMLMLAQTKLWRLDHTGAAAVCQSLLEHNPNDVACLRTLGACAVVDGRHADALALLDRALAIDTRDYQARLWRAEALEHLQRFWDARLEIRNLQIGDYPIWQLLRARIEERMNPRSRIEHDTWFIVDTNIRQLVDADELPNDTGASHEVACAAIDKAIAKLGGNRTKRLTMLTAEGELRWLRTVDSPRQRAELLQLEACHRPLDEVIAEFAALAERYPAVPFFHTYAAELLLWRGEYARACDMFEQVWVTTRTRWGYVGAGAAAMLLGREARALEVWEEGKQYYSYLDAEATYCYRGEYLRKRGDLEAAGPDLERAAKARPGRVGAWVNLALLHHARGNAAGLREAVARVEELIPAYAWEARRAVEIDDRELQGPDTLANYMERLLTWMRGNRSSVMYTIVDANAQLRVIPAIGPENWRDHGRRNLDLFEDALLASSAQHLLETST